MSVIVNSAYLLTLQEAGSANAPIIGYENLVTIDNVSADSEDADFPATNLANPATSNRWKSASTAEQYVTAAIAEVDDVDYVGVARHNFATAGIAVSVEGDDGGGFDELVSAAIPSDDGPLIFRFDPASYESIRLKLAAGSVAPFAAAMYVGKLLVMQRNIYVGHTPIVDGREDRVVSGRSENGNFLGRITTGSSTSTEVSFQNLTAAWYRANFRPFVTASRNAPFFFGWRPGTYPAEVGYAWFTATPRPTNQRSNGMMQVDMQLGGVV
jgi:hypothetical protein